MTNQSLIRLMTWLSPSFPIGGFAWSGGLETACLSGAVNTKEDLRSWITTNISFGPLGNDSIILAAAYRNPDNLHNINQLALALAGSKERFEETTALGNAFTEAAMPWRNADAAALAGPIAYPVAVGSTAHDNDIALRDCSTAYLNSAIGAQIQAALRMIPMGQKAGVSLLSELETLILNKVEEIEYSTLDDLGTSAINIELATLNHETLNSRIFRS